MDIPTPRSKKPAIFTEGYPVADSEDLQRIIALPRRPVLDLQSPRAQALVDHITAKFAKDRAPDDPCRCRVPNKHGPAIAPNRKSCITRLLPVQAWALHEIGIANGCIASVEVGGGKCGCASVEVFDYSAGRRRSIAESGELSVASLSDDALRVSSATAFTSGRKQCVKFTLASGASAEFSTDHPVLTHRGWIDAASLLDTDLVAVAARIPAPVVMTSASDEEVSFVAYMSSDGGVSQKQMSFANMTEAVIDDWQRCTRALGYGISERPSLSKAREFTVLIGRRRGTEGPGHYVHVENPIRERWDLFGLSKSKRVHPDIWGLPDSQVALFLNRFWACDGHVSVKSLEVVLASEKMIDDLVFLLLRLGIRSRKRYKKASYLKNGVRHHFPAWRLVIRGSAAARFLETVGDVLGKENSCQRLRASLASTARNTNYDIVPVGIEEVAEIMDEMRLPKRGDPSASGVRGQISGFLNQTRGQYISRSKFIEFCRQWKYAGKYARFASEDIAWERVLSVVNIGEHPVYDLSVPGPHNFVANGIVVHNTLINILSIFQLSAEDSSSGDRVVTGPCMLGLLLVPPSLLGQLIDDYQLLREHFRVPTMVVHGTSEETRRTFREPDHVPVLHVLPYSRLSLPESSTWIDQFPFEAVIADECDRLKDAGGAGAGRVIKAFGKRGDMRFCGWTGSITDHSLSEFGHLMCLALRDESPMPLDPDAIEDWGRCLDAIDDPCEVGALAQLCAPGDEPTLKNVRRAHHLRLAETIGVIMAPAERIVIEGTDTEIVNEIRERIPPAIPPEVLACLAMVRGNERPDGEELMTALEKAKCAIECAGGMYYRWRFDPIRGVPQKDADVEEWRAARKLFHREVRLKAADKEDWLDSPGLCEIAAKRAWGDVPVDPTRPVWWAEHWPRYRDIKDKVKPTTEAVRVSDYLVRDAAAWALEHRGIVWYSMVEFGAWVAELTGLPLHTGGPKSEARLKKETGETSIIASVQSHGRGRNGLQFLFHEQLITNVFASASRTQQLLGRFSQARAGVRRRDDRSVRAHPRVTQAAQAGPAPSQVRQDCHGQRPEAADGVAGRS